MSTNRARDPHNWAPTIKHTIDGLVDAGLWPNDTEQWVRVADPSFMVGGSKVHVVLQPRDEA